MIWFKSRGNPSTRFMHKHIHPEESIFFNRDKKFINDAVTEWMRFLSLNIPENTETIAGLYLSYDRELGEYRTYLHPIIRERWNNFLPTFYDHSEIIDMTNEEAAYLLDCAEVQK